MKLMVTVLAVAAASTILVSCGGGSTSTDTLRRQLVGEWTMEGEDEVLTFNADGTVTEGEKKRGTWTVSDQPAFIVSLLEDGDDEPDNAALEVIDSRTIRVHEFRRKPMVIHRK